MHKPTKDQLIEKNLKLEKELILKNRELEIEAALEKVRSRMLRMQKSSELEKTTTVMYQQLDALDVVPEGAMVYIVIIDTNTDTSIQWIVTDGTLVRPLEGEFRTPMTEDPRLIKTYKAWKRKDPLLIRDLSGDELEDFKKYIKSLASFREVKSDMDQWPKRLVWSEASFSNGTLGFIYPMPLPAATLDILVRFAKDFDLTYTRFLDLQKAEAQAKEAQIEAALERVRSRSLAMHKTDELLEVMKEVFTQFDNLSLETHACFIDIIKKGSNDFNLWIATPEGGYPTLVVIPYIDNPIFNDYIKSKKSKSFNANIYAKPIKDVFYKHFFKQAGLKNAPKERKKFIKDASGNTFSSSITNHVGFGMVKYNQVPFSDQENDILKRFAKVFDQSYTRFLDLQKAEEQTREAQIENALEKVRSRSLAMHKSDEIEDVISLVFEKLRELDVTMDSACILTFNQVAKGHTVWAANPDLFSVLSTYVPYNDDAIHKTIYDLREKGQDFIDETWTFEEKNIMHEYFFEHTDWKYLPDDMKQMVFNFEGWGMTGPLLKHSATLLVSYSQKTYSKHEKEIIKRFGKVFEQAYIRFLDLQKAEAQAREAQIEAALERVRSRSLAMHKSGELLELAMVVFDQLKELDFALEGAAFIGTPIEGSKDIDIWIGDNDKSYASCFRTPYYETPTILDIWKAKEAGEDFFSKTYSFEEKNHWFEYAFEHTDYKILSDENKQWILEQNCLTQSIAFTKNSMIGIHHHAEKEITEKEIDILKRFAKVFEQTYTRFLDLQKAEAQAREAQIETALEKVRSRSMAMHKSEELLEVINEVFTQFKNLSLETHVCSIDIFKKGSNDLNLWIATAEGGYPALVVLPYIDNPISNDYIKAKKRKSFLKKSYSKPVKDVLYRHFFKQSGLKNASKERKKFIMDAPGFTRSVSFKKHVGFFMLKYDHVPFSEQENDILKRFAKVFDQSYTRFLDLQKAEAQADEARIENALEKVRSRSLAMHKSEELQEVVNTVYDQLVELEINMDSANIMIISEGKRDFDMWTSAPNHIYSTRMHISEINYSPTKDLFNARDNGSDFCTTTCNVEEKNRWFNYAFEHTDLRKSPTERKKFIMESKCWTNSAAISKHSTVQIHSYSRESFSERENDILRRLGKVFEQAYIRFLDLQKAEEQARESQIEAALERVRSKAMAMHSSSDLSDTISTIFIELKSLDIVTIRTGMGIMNEENKNWEMFTTTTGDKKGAMQISGTIPLSGHRALDEMYMAWKEQKDYFPVLRGSELKAYYQFIRPLIEMPDIPENIIHYGYFLTFPEGGLYAWAKNELGKNEIQVFRKFGAVLELTYRRYHELKAAEARALETLKQSSLDRVRAEIASMRNTIDLERITPLVWKELTALGVPFIRCGVFIMEDQRQMIKSYLSSPDGHSLGVFDLPYDSQEIAAGAHKNWGENKIYKDHWTKDQFLNFMQNLVKRGQIKNPESYQGAAKPPESLDLYFLPFKQGMLYVGNIAPLSTDDLQLVQSLANAFSIAYARYEDFKQLEEAKNKTEQTLDELKSTQTQLIQSEKMASLGELTAGIAHEIQNPLNFVNNFAEVSGEMVDEMNEEIETGNIYDVKEITRDLKQNLERIKQHGQRASTIVKGMLEHSRTSTGEKQLTDINKLADEYLRLAYHGLRAKDKSFNADFNTEFDETIPKLNVVAQDIGRVLLNLINNAFYAIFSKSKKGIEDYKPSVIVKTKKNGKLIEIWIQDNGDGIPKDIVDKIFQPFFTTKPTGSGTGLGLSLSYDIIKAHDGDLKVESKNGNGTSLIIELPNKTST